MDLGLSGKRAVVTGASKGIGLAITRALVAEGAHVVAGARSSGGELGELVAGGTVRAVGLDLSTADGPDELIAAALENGPIDVLVNNVGGVHVRLDGFLSVTDEDWLGTWNLGFLAAGGTARAGLPGRRAGRRGAGGSPRSG